MPALITVLVVNVEFGEIGDVYVVDYVAEQRVE